MQDTVLTNSLQVATGRQQCKEEWMEKHMKLFRMYHQDGRSWELTAKGRRPREGRPPHGRRIQAASLISKGLPTGPQGQIGALVPYGAHDSY
jgi:hypothetical protein